MRFQIGKEHVTKSGPVGKYIFFPKLSNILRRIFHVTIHIAPTEISVFDSGWYTY